MFSHAHFDHYDGIYDLPDREKLEVWTLDRSRRRSPSRSCCGPRFSTPGP